MAVTTASDSTVVDASIALEFVAVIALLLSPMQNSVATAGQLAAIRAVILGVPVPVVTGFSSIDTPIAAVLSLATAGTAITIFIVAVITAFVAGLFWGEVLALNRVAATGGPTAQSAGVFFHSVAVIAFFSTFMDGPIATARQRTDR